MNKIVILNGPPGSGKDAIAKKMPRYVQREFKAPLKWLASIIGKIPEREFDSLYNDRFTKEEPMDRLNGMSIRDLMIFVSEDVMKKVHGKAFFGKYAADTIASGADYVFSDGGFPEEIQAVIDATKGTHEVHVVHLYRSGCTFLGDSRDYVHDLEGPYWTHTVFNHEDRLDETVEHLLYLVTTKGGTDLCSVKQWNSEK
jgi:hypothetical protein